MTTLAANKRRSLEIGDVNELPVIASDIIYEGAFVGDNASGYMRPLVSGDRFRGIAESKIDNSAGSAGDKSVRLIERGKVELSISGVAITDVGRPVYASDDDTFNITGIGSYVGRVQRYVSTGVAVVAFDVAMPEDEIIVSLPITLAGVTAADVLTDYVPGFFGRVKKLEFAVTVPVTTGAKLASLNAEIGSTNVTGGVVALTSANCTPLGARVAMSAITAAAAFTPTDTLSIKAASVTAFAEGAGVLLITLGK